MGHGSREVMERSRIVRRTTSNVLCKTFGLGRKLVSELSTGWSGRHNNTLGIFRKESHDSE